LLPSTVTKDDIKITVRADGTYRVFLDNIEPAQSQNFMGSFTEAMAPITNQPYLIPKYEYFGAGEEEAQNETATTSTEIIGQSQASPIYRVVQTARLLVLGKPKTPFEQREHQFCKNYLAGKAKPRIACYHAVPSLLARSEKGREAFEASWNKYVSPGFIVATETKPELLERYFGVGPSLAQRVLWE
jgi:hypothetical protein